MLKAIKYHSTKFIIREYRLQTLVFELNTVQQRISNLLLVNFKRKRLKTDFESCDQMLVKYLYYAPIDTLQRYLSDSSCSPARPVQQQ